jgi:subtilisin family serine protease
MKVFKYCSGKSFTKLVCTLSVASLATLAFASDPALPDEVVVKLRKDQSITSVTDSFGLALTSQFGKRPIYRLSAVGQDVASLLAQLRLHPSVEFAELNFTHAMPEARKTVVWELVSSTSLYTTQWAGPAIQLASAHSVSKQSFPGQQPGAGVRVAVLDTGVDFQHPSLAGKLLGGWDFVDDDANPSEIATFQSPSYGHGTHVAGLVARIAPGAKIVPYRVLDSRGQGNTWVLAEAIMKAVDPDGNPNTDDGAHVINLSLGTTQPTRLLNTAIELATCSDDDDDEEQDDYSDAGFQDDADRCNQLHGTVVVAAAGNSGSADERQYPAAEGAAGAIAVTSFSQNGRL